MTLPAIKAAPHLYDVDFSNPANQLDDTKFFVDIDTRKMLFAY